MFDKPLSRRKHKDYNEELALLILKQYFPGQFSNLTKKDAPDLQDINGRIGIEVVEAIEMKKAEIDGVFSNRRIDNLSITYEKCKEIRWVDINNLPENTIKGIKNEIINVYNDVYYSKD